MQNVSAICFDLDNTLWDLTDVIPRAETLLHEWFADRFPKVSELYTPLRMRRKRESLAGRFPELIHDLSELRLIMLREMLTEAGYDTEPAEEAFEIFFAARNEVELYADVEPALARLRGQYRLLALSNGNACLDTIGIADWFEGHFTARELGIAKPAPEFFSRVVEQAGLDPDTTLHVGDDPMNDVCAPQQIGMRAAWLNRTGADWSLPDCRPELELDGLSTLAEQLTA